MRTGAAFFAGAGSAAIIALGWSMGAQAIAASNHSTSTGTSSAASGSGSTSSGSTSSASPSASAAATGTSGTFTGSSVYEPEFGGSVQVAVTLSNGKITDVQTPVCTATKGREQACPVLNQEVLSAKSANISAIGGATYTSNAYITSLQQALDKAGYKG